MHFGEMLTGSLKGSRAGSDTKPQPRASASAAGCSASLLLAQLGVRLPCACLQPDSPLRGGVYTKIWVFPAQSFYSDCQISLSPFLRATQINARQLCDVLTEL